MYVGQSRWVLIVSVTRIFLRGQSGVPPTFARAETLEELAQSIGSRLGGYEQHSFADSSWLDTTEDLAEKETTHAPWSLLSTLLATCRS